MKNQLILLGTFISLIFVWYVFPTEYERSMNEALKKQKEHSEVKEFDGEVEPLMPNEEENNKTILGADANKNGIRDDVDIWINRTALDSNERLGMRQDARAQQERLRVCSMRLRDEISIVETEIGNADLCLSAVSDYRHQKDYTSLRIWKMIMNNKIRKECPHYFDQFTYPYGGKAKDFHEYCKFKIKDEKDVVKGYKKFWGYVE